MPPTPTAAAPQTGTVRTLEPAEVAFLADRSAFVRDLSPTRSAEQTRQAVQGVDWYHSMYFGHGLVSTGNRDTFAMLEILQLPASLAGKKVLDIGSADGFFSFECEARGAQRVVALDHPDYRAHRPTIAMLRELFSSSIALVEGDIESGATLEPLRSDVVLFLGVLYHLRDPFLTLRRLREITGEVLYVETHVIGPPLPRLAAFGDATPPIAVFYERDELARDASNWWSPNLECLTGMLRAAGFKNIEVLSHTLGDDWAGRATVRAAVG